ncbi:acyl carrier protein [Streptomyces sp. NPDC058067]|uniref:Acyl carrier protein n=1 Tax=Streptomyces antnestii TaxID=2494256 RepID=A0A3S2V5I9_9ACTN|nr:acyl carrier protein [Streptomyces sp. San01]RVU16057.1 acyl carrier protein [Streptomyces sp. San01]
MTTAQPPAHDHPTPQTRETTEAPMTVTQWENELRLLFAEVLGMPDVDADDSFFDLGGHSLLASKLTRRVQEAFGVKVPVRRIYQVPTPATLAAYLHAA